MKAPEKRKRDKNCKIQDNMKMSLKHSLLIITWNDYQIGRTFVKYGCYTTHFQFYRKD